MRRRSLNESINKAKAPKTAVFFKYTPAQPAQTPQRATNTPQDMRIWPGLRLVGAGGKICKGTFVTVKSCSDEVVELEDGNRLAKEDLFKYTRLPHALTYASCQGLTLPGHLVLCDTANVHFTLKHLYVGSSRATCVELLSVL